MSDFKVGDKVIYDDGKFPHKAEVVYVANTYYVVCYKYNGEEVNAFASFTDLKHAEPKPWDGEGLPPKGIMVKFDNYNDLGVIYGHENFGGEVEIVQPLPDEGCCVVRLKYMLGVFDSSFFRPIETPEQKAERERDEILERALDHCLMSDSYKVNLGHLLDAGMLVKKPE